MSFNALLPQSGLATAVANISWTANDSSPVTYRCLLSLAGFQFSALQAPVHALLPSGALPGPPIGLDTWTDCAPPLQLFWLMPGWAHLPIFSQLHVLNIWHCFTAYPCPFCQCEQIFSADQKEAKHSMQLTNLLWCCVGSWKLEVHGQDAAGNAALQDLLAEWTVEMAKGQQYARISSGPFGPTANQSCAFALQV